MDDAAKLDVCLIGHSFLTRLHGYMQSNRCLRNLNLNVDKFHISVCARGGLRVSQLSCSNFLNFSSVPHMCFIQIGENDISRYDCTTLARDILSLAVYLHEGLGISIVIIGQLLRRQPWASTRDFNRKIVVTNQLLKKKCSSQEGIYFWHHRGFWSDLEFLCRDGVHLRSPHPSVHVVTSSPMHKYWRSIRSAILHFQQLLRPV